LDHGIPVSSATTMDNILSASLAPRRFNVLLLSVFSIVALTLAAVGIYGVLSYWVAERTREIGIRTALGANASDILKLVLARAMRIVFIGLIVGAGAGLALAKLLSSTFFSLLYGVKATDPLTYTLVALLLMSVAFIACYIPARRATRVDPLVALK
jgi:putative ABC transport system permease protein